VKVADDIEDRIALLLADLADTTSKEHDHG
jgi:hypothetical protein